ncbi:EAL domain-containing protein [Paraglaciecola arctica]|uniref:Diguanylate phosphodiesterase n=1 Tax=Paraglaciecola arctica BSs20135 TaxID=493475 RepID=K6YR35_9ALTE|nr:EAL domain-containing protein [Paraglaciecola arctica]GAC19113.1 diguanylate phosphodiesterase [Paraglaciecola arctica BSs20135]
MQVTEVTDSFNLDNVVPFFQPIMDLKNEVVWSYECLARLLTFDQNSYLPTEFLFLVERQQSVALLTQTVLSRSASYFRDINMAWNINLSLSDMTDLETLNFLQSQLTGYPNPKRISIEITAQNALIKSAKFSEFSKICGALGINIVIDNFDQQACDFQAILSLPISAIKVSATLFDKVTSDETTAGFVKGLINAAASNNIKVIAERVESQETLEVVKKLGIKYAQGFYFSQPKAKVV